MDYRSKRRCLGLPLIHIARGRVEDGSFRRGVAKGWIAVGDIAFGPLFALGGIAVGGLAIGGFGAMANGFYTVFGLRVLGAPEWEIARFTFILLAGQTVAQLLFGYVGDHVGHKPVLVAGALAIVLGNGVALATVRVEQLYIVFLCMAVALAAGNVSALTFTLEFAPVADRPTYIGLGSTLIAPVAFLSPLVAGLVADSAGYQLVFAIAGLTAALSAGILVGHVRDPRHANRRPRPTAGAA